MAIGLALCLVLVICSSLGTVAYKFATLRDCNRESVLMVERFTILAGVIFAVLWLGDLEWAWEACGLGCAAALFLILGRRVYLQGLRLGPASLSFLIVSMGQSIPVLLAVFLFGEEPGTRQVVGFLLVPVTVFALRRSRQTLEQPDGAAFSPGWLGLILMSALFEGLFASTFLMIRELELGSSRNLFVLSYNLMALMGLALLRRPRSFSVFTRHEIRIGGLGGTVTLGASLASIYAIFHLPAVILFPVALSGSLLLLTGLSRYLWQERLGTRHWIGLGAGLATVALICSPD